MSRTVDKAEIERVNKALFDAFKLDDKSDSLAGYLYLKHMYALSRSLFQALGGEVGQPVQEIGKHTQEMMDMFVDQIITRGISKETSIMHGKIVLPEHASKFVTQTQNMHLVPSEKMIPFKVTREVIFENPDSISLGRCMCRAVVANPCVPPSEQDLCIWIGEPHASFIAAHNEYFRKVTARDAIQVLEDAHKAGFYHCAYFEKPAADRFNCICNCCHCCCFGLRNWPLISSNDNPFLAPSGYAPLVNNDACNGCGDCEERCGFQAIKVHEETKKAVVDMDRCMGCGFCEERCPTGAIEMRLEPKLGEPFDLDVLKAEAARQGA